MIKSMFYLFVIAGICVAAIIGGLNSGNILLGYGIALAVLALVSYIYLRIAKKLPNEDLEKINLPSSLF